jgi:hypothetical protein
MDFDEQLDIEHLLFFERKCRVCNQVKDLVDGFYLTRKGKGTLPSAYSYECKECTKNRVIERRKIKMFSIPDWIYPDW